MRPRFCNTGTTPEDDETAEPVIYLDATDTLHLAWLDRSETGTRLKYASAIWKK